MVRKPAKMYRSVKGAAYTRRKYMGGVPGSRITQFDLGAVKGDFPITLKLTAKETCQIRHTALEAARIAANRYLFNGAGAQGYHLRILPFPHHILRENKMAVGAGADRISNGMSHSFGKTVGTAARLRANQEIIIVRTTRGNIKCAKDALRRASMKLPTPCEIALG